LDYVSNLNISNTEDRDVPAEGHSGNTWSRLSLTYVPYSEKHVICGTYTSYGASGRMYCQQWPAYGTS